MQSPVMSCQHTPQIPDSHSIGQHEADSQQHRNCVKSCFLHLDQTLNGGHGERVGKCFLTYHTVIMRLGMFRMQHEILIVKDL